MMNHCWPDLKDLVISKPMPDGFILDQLEEKEIADLIEALRIWYPTIEVGSESVHLQKTFYTNQVFLKGGDSSKNIYPYTIKQADKIVGMFTLQWDENAQSLIGRLGAVAPSVRGRNLASEVPELMIEIGLKLKAGIVHSFATLSHPYSQRVYEQAGYKPVGIVPAFDLDFIEGIGNKRVYEVLYAKVLVGPDEILAPVASNMTSEVKKLWTAIFPDQTIC